MPPMRITCVYIIVVATLVWPSSSWTVRMSLPHCSRCVSPDPLKDIHRKVRYGTRSLGDRFGADRIAASHKLYCSLSNKREITMAKAYWISVYRAVKDADKLAAYAKLAGPAITAGGGRFLARGLPAKVYEFGLPQRSVLIEFDSVEQATAVHDSPDYQAALAALGDGAERDLRIVEGV